MESNADVNPGQETYFTTHRGDGSFDYDCSDSTDKQDICTKAEYCSFGDTCVDNGPPGGVQCTCPGAALQVTVHGGGETVACGADIVEMVIWLKNQWCEWEGSYYSSVGVYDWSLGQQPYACPHTIQRGDNSPYCGCR
jgi:hypothetical protein